MKSMYFLQGGWPWQMGDYKQGDFLEISRFQRHFFLEKGKGLRTAFSAHNRGAGRFILAADPTPAPWDSDLWNSQFVTLEDLMQVRRQRTRCIYQLPK